MSIFKTELKDFSGKPIMGVVVAPDGAASFVPATLGSVAADALSNAPASVNLSTEEKVRAFKLAQTVLAAGEAPLAVESVALIKKCIGAVQTPVVVGRCFEILDPASLADPPSAS